MACDAYTMPSTLPDFAMIPRFEEVIDELADLVEAEDWEYHNTESDRKKPILHNYIKHTYSRLAEEKKISVSNDEQYASWNSGLITPNQEPVYFVFEKHRMANAPMYWHYKCLARKGERELNRFDTLPEMAHYFEDPSCLVYDSRWELRVNTEHIIAENKGRFPADLQEMNDFGLQNLVKGAIESVKERVKRNYKTAIPQYYNGAIQLLLPLCLTEPKKADLAMVVERYSTFYRASTCLTLDMAYNNARQLTKPDREWLQP